MERDGEIIRVRDTVLLKSGPRKKSMPYVAKISALWEDPKTGTRGTRSPIEDFPDLAAEEKRQGIRLVADGL